MTKKKLIIEIANPCNNNCIICNSPKKAGAGKDEFIRVLKEYASKGFCDLDINGSEPTLNPDLLDIIKAAKLAGYKRVTLFTNGRLLSYEDRLKSVVEAGVAKLIFNVYSYRSETHDKISLVPDSWWQTNEGMKNAIKYKGLSVGANVAVCRENYRDLPKTVEYLLGLGIEFINVSPVFPSLFNPLENALSDAGTAFKKEMAGILAGVDDTRVRFHGFPRCFIHSSESGFLGKEIVIVDKNAKVLDMNDIYESKFHYTDACFDCEYQQSCQGYINEGDSDDFFSLWCASDLHASELNRRLVEEIYSDVSGLCFSRGVVAGDFVEGELDPSSYEVYKNILDNCGFAEKLNHVVGNHEYLYRFGPETYNLDRYRELFGPNLSYSNDFGNLHIIYLPLDKSPRSARSETLAWLQTEIRNNFEKIIIVVSHYPASKFARLDTSGIDIWISGHGRFIDKNGGYKEIFQSGYMYNIYAGGIDILSTKLLVFRDASDNVLLKVRDHKNKRFNKSVVIKLKKRFRLDPDQVRPVVKKMDGKMRYSIPFNSDLTLIRWAISSGQVGEVYFAGPQNNDFSDPYDELARFGDEEIKELIGLCNQNGIKTNFLLNKHIMFFENKPGLEAYVDSLLGFGKIDYFTISDPYLAGYLRQRYPDIGLQSSVFMGIDSAVRVREGIKMGITSFCLDPFVNRNFAELKRIAELKDTYDISIKLLGMHGCYAACFFAWKHSQLPILKKAAESMGAESSACLGMDIDANNCHYRSTGLADEIRRPFIRPEDVEFYERHGLADLIKVAYRDNSSEILKKKYEAYFSRKYRGNLFEILPSNKHLPLVCDNSKIPDDFIDRVMCCDDNCDDCSYCRDIATQCISEKDKPIVNRKLMLINPISADPPPMYFGPPYGLALIAAILEENGYDPICFDFDTETEEEMYEQVVSTIKKQGIKRIGISLQSSNRAYVYRLIERIKDYDHNIVIILGGPFATQKYELLLDNFPIDYIVMGDGEFTMLELMMALDSGGDIAEVAGVAFKQDEGLVLTKERERLKNLDELPYPAFHLFDVEGRLKRQDDLLASEAGRRNLEKIKGKRCFSISNALMLLSSVGCIYGCSFCPMSGVQKDKYREHSARYFVDMLEHFAKRYKQRQFVVGDNFFTKNRERVMEICRLIIARGLDIEWICMTRADYVDEEMLVLMRQAGCLDISFGVETCSEIVQKAIGKNLDLKNVPEAFTACDRAGIRATLMLMVGNQGESKHTIYETLTFVRDLEPEEAIVHTTKSYPGTRINELMEEAGIIKQETYLKEEISPPVFSLEKSEDEIAEYRKMIRGREVILKTSLPNGEAKNRRSLEDDILRLAKRAEYLNILDEGALKANDLLNIIVFAKEYRVDKLILEAGYRIFIDQEFINALLRAGLYGIRTIVPKSPVFDTIASMTGVWKEFLVIIGKITAQREDMLEVILPITRSNHKRLVDMAKRLVSEGVRNIIFKHDARTEDLLPLPELKSYLIEALKYLKSKNVRFTVFGVPYCIVGAEFEDQIGEIHQPWDEDLDDEGELVNIGKRRRSQRVKNAYCHDCRYDMICEGFWKGYELEPETGIDRCSNTNTMLLTLTRHCQFDCSYCHMEKKGEDMNKDDMHRLIDLFLTAKDDDLELQFFGGEPLLRFDLIQAGVAYASRLAGLRKKKLRFLITSNALALETGMLDFIAENSISMMFSLDGSYETSKQSRHFSSRESYDRIIENIQNCAKRGIDYFVNMTVSPENIGKVEEDITALAKSGINSIKLSYSLADYWGTDKQLAYIKVLAKIEQGIDGIQFFDSREEQPALASPVVIADTDASVYVGCSLVTESELPSLNRVFYRGKVSEIKNMDVLETKRSEQLSLLLGDKRISERERRIIINNLSFGDSVKNPRLLYDNDTAFLELQITSRCQLDCAYCSLDRSRPDMEWPLVKEGIDFLFSSHCQRLKLQFFGGEPLLRFDLIEKGMEYAVQKAENAGREIVFVVSTNGLALDRQRLEFFKKHKTVLIFSLDGCKNVQSINRPTAGIGSEYPYDKIMINLQVARELGIEMFVNMVIRPNQVDNIKKNLKSMQAHFTGLNVVLSYALGDYWDREARENFMGSLRDLKEDEASGYDIINFDVDDEPTIAATSLNLDQDAKLYLGCTLSMTRAFPSFSRLNYVANIHEITCYDEIVRDRNTQASKLLLGLYDSFEESELVKNNLDFGWELKQSNKIQKNQIKTEMETSSMSDDRINEVYLLLQMECELRCRVCPYWGANGACHDLAFNEKYGQDRKLELKRILHLLEEVSRYNPRTVTLSGGEPLEYRDWNKVAAKAKELGLKLALSTNGLLLGRYIDEVLEYVDSIQLNLGGTKDVIGEVRQADYGYDEVIKNIRDIQQKKAESGNSGPEIGIIYVITDKNYHKIGEFYDYFKNEGIKVDGFYFQHMMFVDKPSLDKQSEFLRSHGMEPMMWKGYLSSVENIDFGVLRKQLAYVSKKPGVRISPQLEDKELELYYDSEKKMNIKREMTCFAPWRQVDVYPNGDVLYCPDYVIGNIYKDSFKNIWNGETNQRMRAYISEHKRLPACHSCFYYYVTNEDP